MKINMVSIILTLLLVSYQQTSFADAKHQGGIQAISQTHIQPEFDIVHAKVVMKDNVATFHMAVSGKAGGLSQLHRGNSLAPKHMLMYGPLTLIALMWALNERRGS
ncbi:hypothetical protein [Shewanella marina]|uniref:hypothetical protein n=1 Tax=Shewanella marina TaxID=487319 RepID=UPI000A9BC02C|nr:hypothetical protein [Shewanella marina]